MEVYSERRVGNTTETRSVACMFICLRFTGECHPDTVVCAEFHPCDVPPDTERTRTQSPEETRAAALHMDTGPLCAVTAAFPGQPFHVNTHLYCHGTAQSTLGWHVVLRARQCGAVVVLWHTFLSHANLHRAAHRASSADGRWTMQLVRARTQAPLEERLTAHATVDRRDAPAPSPVLPAMRQSCAFACHRRTDRPWVHDPVWVTAQPVPPPLPLATSGADSAVSVIRRSLQLARDNAMEPLVGAAYQDKFNRLLEVVCPRAGGPPRPPADTHRPVSGAQLALVNQTVAVEAWCTSVVRSACAAVLDDPVDADVPWLPAATSAACGRSVSAHLALVHTAWETIARRMYIAQPVEPAVSMGQTFAHRADCRFGLTQTSAATGPPVVSMYRCLADAYTLHAVWPVAAANASATGNANATATANASTATTAATAAANTTATAATTTAARPWVVWIPKVASMPPMVYMLGVNFCPLPYVVAPIAQWHAAMTREAWSLPVTTTRVGPQAATTTILDMCKQAAPL
jgi:hypothetical protein